MYMLGSPRFPGVILLISHASSFSILSVTVIPKLKDGKVWHYSDRTGEDMKQGHDMPTGGEMALNRRTSGTLLAKTSWTSDHHTYLCDQ